jgi:hypothetical protein
MVAGTSMKMHLQLPDTLEIGLARVRVQAHVTHVPNKCRLKGVDLGNGPAEFGDGKSTPLDMDVSNKGDVEVANIPGVGLGDGRHVIGCAEACYGRK